MPLARITDAIDALRRGSPVIVVDAESRENEGDVVFSADLATPQTLAWTVRNSSGFVCAPLTNSIADQLELPLMVANNQDRRGTAYTVTVDAASSMGTGISATDRAFTLNVLADKSSRPGSLRRPGHILPLRAVEGGVLERPGHTEAAVDLMKLAGLAPVAGIAEIVSQDGEMARLPELIVFGAREHVPVISIEALIDLLST